MARFCIILLMALAVTSSDPISSSSEEFKPVQATTERRCIMNITESGNYEMIPCVFKTVTVRNFIANGISFCTHCTPDGDWSLEDEIVIINNVSAIFNECKILNRLAARSLRGLIANLGLERITLKELIIREADPLLQEHCYELF